MDFRIDTFWTIRLENCLNLTPLNLKTGHPKKPQQIPFRFIQPKVWNEQNSKFQKTQSKMFRIIKKHEVKSPAIKTKIQQNVTFISFYGCRSCIFPRGWTTNLYEQFPNLEPSISNILLTEYFTIFYFNGKELFAHVLMNRNFKELMTREFGLGGKFNSFVGGRWIIHCWFLPQFMKCGKQCWGFHMFLTNCM
jgi:hypothetical protein